MKKITLVALFLTVILTSVTAQKFSPGFHLGIKAGANLNKIDGQGYDQAFNLNYHAGAFAQIQLLEGFGIQPELVFSQSTSKTASNFSAIYTNAPGVTASSNNQEVKLNYLSIPILANFGKSFIKLQVGPQFSILMNQSKNLRQNGADAFKNGDFAMVGGLWLQLPLGLNASARYIVGLSNLNDLDNSNQWKSQAIQLGVGIRF